MPAKSLCGITFVTDQVNRIALPDMPAFDGVVPAAPHFVAAGTEISQRLRSVTGVGGSVHRLDVNRPSPQGVYRIGTGTTGALAKVVPNLRSADLDRVDKLLANLSSVAPIVRPVQQTPMRYDAGHMVHAYPLIQGRFAEPSMLDCFRVGAVIALLHRSLAGLPDSGSIRQAASDRHHHLETVAAAIAEKTDQLGSRSADLAQIAPFVPEFGGKNCQPLHGDLNPGNVLLVDGGADVVIDFEDALHSWGEVEADIAFAIERFCIVPARQQEQCIALSWALVSGYRVAGGIPVFDRPGSLLENLKAANWRALMVLAALEARGESRPATEWKKFLDFWANLEANKSLISEIETRATCSKNPLAPAKALFSARDANAAEQLIAILSTNSDLECLDVTVVADGPARDRLRSAGIPAHRGPGLSVCGQEDADALLGAARALYRSIKPRIVVTGLSGPDAGVDEALIHVSEVPSVAVQDYWGDVNLALGRPADTYLVTDRFAKGITEAKVDVKAVITGQPKYSQFLTRSVAERIDHVRRTLKIRSERSLMVFAGQPLWHEPAYARVVSAVAKSFAAMTHRAACDPHFLYRPHPRESFENIRNAELEFEALGLSFDTADQLDIVDIAAAANVLITCFSQTAFDKVMINRISETPAGVALYVMPPPIMSLYRRLTGLESLPGLDLGLVPGVRVLDEIDDALADASRPTTAQTYWQAAQDTLSDPAFAAHRALMAICDQLDRSQNSDPTSSQIQ